MSAGELVPDELVITLLRKRLTQKDAADGAIFDGYPRTTAQARALDSMLRELQRSIDRVVGSRRFQGNGRGPYRRKACVLGLWTNLSCSATMRRPLTGRAANAARTRSSNARMIRRSWYERDMRGIGRAHLEVLEYYNESRGDRDFVRQLSGVGSLDEVTQTVLEAIDCA